MHLRRRPAPGHELVNAGLGPTVDETGQQIREVGLRIDLMQLAGLCRMPDYAEVTLSNPQVPLISVRFARHSLTPRLLADTAAESGPVSTGDSENAYLTAVCARCPGHKVCDWCL